MPINKPRKWRDHIRVFCLRAAKQLTRGDYLAPPGWRPKCRFSGVRRLSCPKLSGSGELVFTGNSMPAGLPGNLRKSGHYGLLRDNRLRKTGDRRRETSLRSAPRRSGEEWPRTQGAGCQEREGLQIGNRADCLLPSARQGAAHRRSRGWEHGNDRRIQRAELCLVKLIVVLPD
jgi:hypothetical protein